MAAEILTSSGTDIRENLVTTAIKFLTNPNVQRCTMESKERFLRSKGLTDAEIHRALEKCGEMLDVPSLSSELMLFHHSRRSWFRERILPLIVYGGFIYGCYWFYKNCIRHILFVEPPKRKSVVECMDEVRKSLDVMNASISSLRAEVQAAGKQNALRGQMETLKDDITFVKGLLLNRNQFSALKTRSEVPSIPKWQQQSEEATSTEVPEEVKPHRSRSQRSESGGSNSSEGEQATKNSDSSLEIIT